MHESHASASFSGETNSFEFGFSAPSGGDRILVFHENEEKKRSVQLSWEGGGGNCCDVRELRAGLKRGSAELPFCRMVDVRVLGWLEILVSVVVACGWVGKC